MKKNLYFAAFVFVLIGCNAGDKVSPASPAACTDPLYSRGRILTNIRTYVLAKTTEGPNGKTTIYYLDNPDTPSLAAPYTACNLPVEFQKDKLAVRFNAYQLTWPDMENQNYYGSPLELIHIETR